MADRKITDLVDGDPLQPTDEFVVARAGDNFKIDGAAVVAAVTKHDVTLSGNTAGALAAISSGTLTLAGGNNITLSQAGNAVTISGGAAGGFSGGMSTQGNTSGDTGYASQRLNLVGGNNITLSGSTNGGSMSLTISGPAAAGAQTGISGIAASNTTYTSGSVTITGVGGGVTVSSNTGQRIDISVAAQSVQPETQTFIGGISASNTLYTSGSVRFTGSQAVTVRSGTGQLVVIDVPAQTTQVETQTFVGGLAASNTTYTSGTVTITGVGGGITVSSNTGQRIDLSVAAQTVQTQGILSAGVSTGGNTAGNTQVSTGSRLVIVGSNGITASQGTAAGATTITLSGATQTVQTQGNLSMGVSTGGNTVGNTTVNTGSRFVLVASGNATASQATAAGASTVTISVGTQTVQTQDVLSVGASNVGNTSGDTTVNTGSRLVFAGGNNITISQGTAAGATTLTISGPNVGGAQTGISAIANSETTYTSGSVTLSALGAVTIRSTTGQHFQISVNSQTAQTGISGIANSQTTYTSGTVSLSELGAITIRSTTGNQYQLSVNAQSVQPETQTFLAGIQNSQTTYTSGTVNLSVVAGNLTIRSTTGQAFQFSMSQTVQPETQTAISGIANSQTTYTSGTVSLSELGAITIRSTTGNQYQLSVNAQTTQTQGILSAGVSTGGNTAGNTTVNTGSRLVLVGAGDISLSQATAAGASTISISGSQSIQTQDVLSIGVSTGGNTAGNTTVNTGSRLVIVGSNGITASQGTAAGATTITLSGVTQSVQTQGILNVALSTGGNTLGDTGLNSGTRLVLAGGNNITLSGSSAANASTITIIGPSPGAAQYSVGVSTGGNTAGQTGVTGTRIVFAGSSPVSLSQATDATGATISIQAPATSSLSATGIVSISTNGSTISIGAVGGGGGVNAGVSTFGNTAGSTGTVSTGNVVFVGSGPISLSQSTGAAGSAATISINGPATSSLSATGIVSISTNGSTISIGVPGTAADWQNFPQGNAALQTHISVISKTPFYWNENLPQRITANSLVFRVSMVTASQPLSLSAHMGIYTKVNSTSMALLGSFSEAYVVSSASSVSFSGVRNLVMTGIGTHTALSVLGPGNYGFGMMFSATATNAMNASLMGASTANGPLGILLPGTNSMSTGTSQGAQALWGRGSTTVNAMPANVSRPDLINQGSGASMQLHPWIYIRS